MTTTTATTIMQRQQKTTDSCNFSVNVWHLFSEICVRTYAKFLVLFDIATKLKEVRKSVTIRVYVFFKQ